MAGALHNVQFCTKIEIEICFHERADITNAFSETYPNYSIDYRLFDISYYEKNRIYTREKKYVYLTRA